MVITGGCYARFSLSTEPSTRIYDVVDGRAIAFWLDEWCGDCDFASRFTALLSHCTDVNTSVKDIMTDGISAFLRSRLYSAVVVDLLLLHVASCDCHSLPLYGARHSST